MLRRLVRNVGAYIARAPRQVAVVVRSAKYFAPQSRLLGAKLMILSCTKAVPRGPIKQRTVTLRTASGVVEMAVRVSASDAEVLREVYVQRVYDLDYETLLGNVDYIVDLGAHIGSATKFFAVRFPSAQILALEPADSNYALLELNTRHLKHVRLEHGAVASADGVRQLLVSRWLSSATLVASVDASRRRRTRRPENRFALPPQSTQAYSLPTLLSRAGFPRIDVLKVDIEGGEIELLSSAPAWLQMTRLIVVEHHYPHVDPEPMREALHRAGFRQVGPSRSRVEVYQAQ